MVVTLLLAVITILVGTLTGILGWIAIRLVRQLDQASRSCSQLLVLVDKLDFRITEHEKWHSYRTRASDQGNRSRP